MPKGLRRQGEDLDLGGKAQLPRRRRKCNGEKSGAAANVRQYRPLGLETSTH